MKALVISFLCLVGCGKVEEPTGVGHQAASTASVPSYAGLKLTFEQSGFDVGEGITTMAPRSLLHTGGNRGTYALDKVTGSSLGVRKAGAEYSGWSKTREEHEQTVLAFYVARGLPSDQVQGTHSIHLSTGGGRTADERAELTHVFLTSVDRQIEGVSVAESVAGAELSEAGAVVRQQLNWPAIPASVVVDAHALEEAVAANNPVLMDALPSDARDGAVRIHHGLVLAQKAMAPVATYDVQSGAGAVQRVRSYALDGHEVQLVSLEHDPGTQKL